MIFYAVVAVVAVVVLLLLLLLFHSTVCLKDTLLSLFPSFSSTIN